MINYDGVIYSSIDKEVNGKIDTKCRFKKGDVI